jgi:hypothetical protein
MKATHTFQEDKNTTWFCQFMPHSREWMIWCERNEEKVRGTLIFRKRLNKEWKVIFKIK